MDLKETDILGDDVARHWYYQSKANAVMRLIGSQSISEVLDIGAGSGFFTQYLLRNTSATEAWCVDITYDADSDANEEGKSTHYRRSIDRTNADLVLLMDVLEHVDDDLTLLASYVEKAPSGTRFLISVPAFQFLWSSHDEYLEHRRRYTLCQLEDLVTRSGLTVNHGAYYFAAVFPIAAVMRLADRWKGSHDKSTRSQLKRHHPFTNEILKTICRVEMPLLAINRFAGLTVFCLSEKP